MESSFRFRPSSHQHQHHHHHHHHHHHLCHHHRHNHHHEHHTRCHHHHHQFCSLHHHCNCHSILHHSFAPLPLQHPQPIFSAPSTKESNLQPYLFKETPASVALVPQEPELHKLDVEDEEEEDPVFVLTDEWREFFAKSEAKRKLEKQRAKRKDRH